MSPLIQVSFLQILNSTYDWHLLDVINWPPDYYRVKYQRCPEGKVQSVLLNKNFTWENAYFTNVNLYRLFFFFFQIICYPQATWMNY